MGGKRERADAAVKKGTSGTKLFFWATALYVVWAVFFERHYWEFPAIPEDPEEVAEFKKMVDDFMANDFQPLTEGQIDQYFRDGWITMDAYVPKPICKIMAKYNDYFTNYTWHYNTYEDYSTKGYMGFLESEVYRYFDKHGPLKYVNKQILDRYYNTTLPGTRLWNELVISTNSDVNGIRIHYDRGSYSHLADEDWGSSSWIMMADFDTRIYGKGLAMINMSHVPDYCLDIGQEGQNFFPKGDECIKAVHDNTHPALVGQGALVLFSRWCYHRTASGTGTPIPKGLERAVHVTRWVHPAAKASLVPTNDKTGGSRAGNKAAAVALGARNYFCRSHPNRQEKPFWKAYIYDMMHGSDDMGSADSFTFKNCVPDAFNDDFPTYNDVSLSYTVADILEYWPSYYFGEKIKNWKMYMQFGERIDKTWDNVDLETKLSSSGVMDQGQSKAGANPNIFTGQDA